ncbi:MAG: siderophore-interacting protein [Gordonia sp. (in: high G+C Gram-positive bacteria)]|uniref:siderophore-interacting protein n=1 Tax=Gordonia sp. (in: high G+C Gram-positive bacteria) TaxID=84139 RepID=UPI0039E485E0
MTWLFTATSVTDVTPGMRRVVFTGEAVGEYLADGLLPNIKILLPKPDGTYGVPELDDPSSHEVTDLPRRADLRPRVRTYTVRSFDEQARSLTIDFVNHGDEGLASGWAARAEPGSTLCAAGGGGRAISIADTYLLAGDETALPAIGSILETMDPAATGTAYIEIADDGERQDLQKPSGVDVVWLSRDGAPAGTTTLLQDAVAAHELPDGVFAWASAESAQTLAIRKDLRARGLDRKSMLVIGYWRRGFTEIDYATTSNHDRDDS